jgi:hypothetical protein
MMQKEKRKKITPSNPWIHKTYGEILKKQLHIKMIHEKFDEIIIIIMMEKQVK